MLLVSLALKDAIQCCMSHLLWSTVIHTMLLLHLALAMEMQNQPHCLTQDMTEPPVLEQTGPPKDQETPVPMLLHLAYIRASSSEEVHHLQGWSQGYAGAGLQLVWPAIVLA